MPSDFSIDAERALAVRLLRHRSSAETFVDRHSACSWRPSDPVYETTSLAMAQARPLVDLDSTGHLIATPTSGERTLLLSSSERQGICDVASERRSKLF